MSVDVPSALVDGRRVTVKLPGRIGRDQIATALRDGGWGGFEPPLPSVLAACAATHPGVVYDVGANTGFYSVVAASVNEGNHVFAFEPFPDVFSFLTTTLKLNGLDDRVHAQPVALGAGVGRAPLYVPVQDHGLVETSSTLSRNFKPEHSQVIDVPVSTVDAFASERGHRVSVMKIDVESCEADVLRGGAAVLARDRPLVFCEVLPDGDAVAIDKMRQDADYVDIRLHPTLAEVGGPVAFDAAGWNHLLAPKEMIDQVTALLVRCGLEVAAFS